MISIKNKFIIITPPKTGSVSIVTSMMEYIEVYRKVLQHGHSETFPTHSDCFDYTDPFSTMSKHTSINEMYKRWNKYKNIHSSINEVHKRWNKRVKKLGDFNDYQKFGTVRNPWDRVVSWWKFRKIEGETLLGFLNDPSTYTSRDMLQDHFSIDNKIVINSYIRFENIQKDYNRVCNQIGVPTKELLHMNKSKHKHYTEYYNNETREIVAQRYKKDIEYFGYKFGE